MKKKLVDALHPSGPGRPAAQNPRKWGDSRITIFLLCLLCLFVASARADLSAVVSPGYTFAANERPTTATLNRAANPTITITGTVGGTNANLANNSVNGAQLVTGFPGSNLTWDASSPRKLVITNDGVNVLQLHSNVAGLGLSGGSGSQLRVNVDTNTVTITNNVVTLNLTTFSNLVNLLATNVARYQVTNAPINVTAWCKFSGTATGTNEPTAGYNVTNIVRTGTGLYTVNFSNALATANYAITATPMSNSGSSPDVTSCLVLNQTTTNFTLATGRSSWTPGDAVNVYITLTQ